MFDSLLEPLHRGNQSEVRVLAVNGTKPTLVEKRLYSFCDVSPLRKALYHEAYLQGLAAGSGVVPILSPACVYTAGECSQLTRPFISGHTLQQLFCQGSELIPSLNVPQIIEALSEILMRLHHLGSDCLVHRDITPSNVFVDDNQRVWLNDFGQARLLSEAELLPSERLSGSPTFMPPELRGEGALSEASDIYQLALLYCWMRFPQLQNMPEGKNHMASTNSLQKPSSLARIEHNTAWHEQARSLLSKSSLFSALHKQPQGRPTAAEVHSMMKIERAALARASAQA